MLIDSCLLNNRYLQNEYASVAEVESGQLKAWNS